MADSPTDKGKGAQDGDDGKVLPATWPGVAYSCRDAIRQNAWLVILVIAVLVLAYLAPKMQNPTLRAWAWSVEAVLFIFALVIALWAFLPPDGSVSARYSVQGFNPEVVAKAIKAAFGGGVWKLGAQWEYVPNGETFGRGSFTTGLSRMTAKVRDEHDTTMDMGKPLPSVELFATHRMTGETMESATFTFVPKEPNKWTIDVRIDPGMAPHRKNRLLARIKSALTPLHFKN